MLIMDFHGTATPTTTIRFAQKVPLTCTSVQTSPPPVLMVRDNLGSSALGAHTYNSPASSFADPSMCPGGSCEADGNECYMPDGTVSKFTSIPLSLWFVSVTMCTVGFGDLVSSEHEPET
eukprot:3376768-Rhodomonas_salina.1